jgi:hypothetical protein
MTVRLSVLRAGRPLPPGSFLVLIFVRAWVDSRAIVRLEGLGQLKYPVPSSGIESATFRLVAQCLNQLRYRMPTNEIIHSNYINDAWWWIGRDLGGSALCLIEVFCWLLSRELSKTTRNLVVVSSSILPKHFPITNVQRDRYADLHGDGGVTLHCSHL